MVNQLQRQPSWLRFWRPNLNKHRIRRLRPRDTLAIIFHFVRLSSSDRFQRFNSRTRFHTLFRRYDGIDWEQTRFLGVFSGSRLVAVAELAKFVENGERCTELALSVNGNWQKQGLGENLYRRVLKDSQMEGHVRVVLYCQVDNTAIIHLARKLSGTETRSESELVFVHTLQNGL